jgi:hypothetical protein
MATRAKLTIVLAFFAGIIGGASSRYLVPIPLHAQTQTDKDGVLHVRGIVVDDQNGHERVRLGAPVPDPLIHGVRRKRVAPVSGLIITDGAGNERGGFTTNEVGEAFIGLDSEDEQQVLFLANPHGGVNFDLFDSKGNEAQILVFPNGPTFTMKKAKQTVLELPK